MDARQRSRRLSLGPGLQPPEPSRYMVPRLESAKPIHSAVPAPSWAVCRMGVDRFRQESTLGLIDGSPDCLLQLDAP